jgi:hypothetical protein
LVGFTEIWTTNCGEPNLQQDASDAELVAPECDLPDRSSPTVETERWVRAVSSCTNLRLLQWQRPGRVGDLLASFPKPSWILNSKYELVYGNRQGAGLFGEHVGRLARKRCQLRDFVSRDPNAPRSCSPLSRSPSTSPRRAPSSRRNGSASSRNKQYFTPIFAGTQGVDVIVRCASRTPAKFVLTMSQTSDREGNVMFLAVFHGGSRVA